MFKYFAMTVLLGLLVSPSPSALAAGRSIAGQKVVRMSTGWGAEGIYVATDINAPVVGGCGGSIYIIESTHPMMRDMTALLLAARQANTTIDLYTDGCRGTDMVLKAVTTY